MIHDINYWYKKWRVENKKVDKLKELADKMYYAAQHLTTDASRLHKAMEDYKNYIICELKEE